MKGFKSGLDFSAGFWDWVFCANPVLKGPTSYMVSLGMFHDSVGPDYIPMLIKCMLVQSNCVAFKGLVFFMVSQIIY